MVDASGSVGGSGDVLGRVVFTREEICELDRGRKVVRVPRDEIRLVELCRDSSSHHPILQAALGVVLGIAGLWGAGGLVAWLWEGGRLYVEVTTSLMLLVPAGAWVVFDALRSRVLLRLRVKKGQRKLLFGRELSKSEEEQLPDLVRSACARNSYPCEISF